MITLYYFGCIKDVGHFFFYSNENRHICQTNHIRGMSQNLFRAIDGTFCPPPTWPNGTYMESFVPPWRIISWWDNSIDSRPGSHSTFIGHDFSCTEELLTAAQLAFPEVFQRQKLPILRG